MLGGCLAFVKWGLCLMREMRMLAATGIGFARLDKQQAVPPIAGHMAAGQGYDMTIAHFGNSLVAGRIMMLAALLATMMAVPAQAADGGFVARCGMCHQAGGDGLAGQFPRLSGRAAAIAQTPPGRRYLVRVLLGGMAGPITVDGKPLAGVMPGMASLTDQQIAEVLSHAITLGKPARAAKPFTPAEVAIIRAEGRPAMADNAALRAELAAKGVIP